MLVLAVAASAFFLANGIGRAPGGTRILARVVAGAVAPDLSPAYLAVVLGDAVTTASYALAGMSVATVGGILAAILSSGAWIDRAWVRAPVRIVLAGLRAPHELVWALLLVHGMGLSPVVGVLAIGIPYIGVVGRVLGDAIRDVDPRPLQALEASGASRGARFLYGVAPQVAADAIGYLAYRFECAMRTAAVLSFVGLGGLGLRIDQALLDLDFARAWTPIYATVGLVLVVDLVGSRARRRFTR